MRDGFLKTPLADARVSLLTTDSIVVQDSIKVTLRKRNGERWGTANFVIQLPKKTCTYLLRATMDGYEDAWQSLSVLYTLHEAISLSYQYKNFTAKAMGDVRWRHSEGKMRDFTTLDAFDYQYGLMARYTLPDIKTTLSADANIYSRRGYGSKTLNTDDFVMNASVSQPFLKGKLIASVAVRGFCPVGGRCDFIVNGAGHWSLRVTAHYDYFCKTAIIGESLS